MLKQFEDFTTRIIYNVLDKSQDEEPVIYYNQNECYFLTEKTFPTGKRKLISFIVCKYMKYS